MAADPLGVGIPRCGSCGAAILWATMSTGSLMPVDYPPLEREPQPRDVMRNPHTGTGAVVKKDALEFARRALAAGATLHTSHFATCANADRHRRGRP